MSKHKVGNYYKLLGHILRLEEVMQNRCKLSCCFGCCAKPYGVEMECHLNDLDNMELVKEVKERSEIDWQMGDTAEVKGDWDLAGTRFRVLGPAVFLKQWWVPVEDPNEPDPTFFKEDGLRKVVVE